jgi:hypothetical protein
MGEATKHFNQQKLSRELFRMCVAAKCNVVNFLISCRSLKQPLKVDFTSTKNLRMSGEKLIRVEAILLIFSIVLQNTFDKENRQAVLRVILCDQDANNLRKFSISDKK